MRLSPEPPNEFQRRWIRNWLTVFLPGFAIFGIGGVTELKPLIILGWLVALVGMAREYLLTRKFRRRTGCGFISYPRIGDDGSCFYCGVELPLNGPD